MQWDDRKWERLFLIRKWSCLGSYAEAHKVCSGIVENRKNLVVVIHLHLQNFCKKKKKNSVICVIWYLLAEGIEFRKVHRQMKEVCRKHALSLIHVQDWLKYYHWKIRLKFRRAVYGNQPYSPDLLLNNFHIFFRKKNALKIAVFMWSRKLWTSFKIGHDFKQKSSMSYVFAASWNSGTNAVQLSKSCFK